MNNKNKPVRFSIRTKLLLLSIAFLLVPYTAYRSLLELETSLRQGLEAQLLDVAHSLSALLSYKQELLRQDLSVSEQHLFIHDLKQPINLDGYKDEWVELLDWSTNYKSEQDNNFSYRLVLAKQGHQLYALLDVHDQSLVYHRPDNLTDLKSDHISMLFESNQSEMLRYEFAAEAPGKLIPFLLEEYWLYEEDREYLPPEYRKVFITNVQGNWQQTEQGYTLELAIPWHVLDGKLGFIVHDFDEGKEDMANQLSSFINSDPPEPNTLIRQSNELNQIINSLGITEARRIWVLDTLGQVVAVDGSLKSKIEKTPVNLFYEIILPKTYELFQDELTEASRLEGKEIQQALSGQAGTRWRSSIDDKAVILSAAVPIKKENEVIGLVVVEETTNNIQILKRDALAKLFSRTLLVFTIITLLLLLFASHLSFRLRRLSRQSNDAIDEHGRVVGMVKASHSNDELGELSRNYANILYRLKQYHEYLEGMAGKLSHELRTPMAVVQSSLENLELEKEPDAAKEYLLRAKEGIKQLNHLVSRLSEAARLEQAMQASELESVDLHQLLSNCFIAYQDAFPDVSFQFNSELKKLNLTLAPELVVQMLDKLVSNAVDFHKPGSPVLIELKRQKPYAIISVMNQGPLLNGETQAQLFQSMVSKRKEEDKQQPHLGLGLYIVRLIAEFHGGKVSAENLSDNSGVRFSVMLPV